MPCAAFPLQGVGATPGCVRRRGRLAEMLLERGKLDEAETLLRNILGYVESTQVGAAGTVVVGGGADGRGRRAERRATPVARMLSGRRPRAQAAACHVQLPLSA